MTGLEKIQAKILAQSDENCEKIIAKANEEAKAILINARQTASEAAQKIIKDAEMNSDKKQLLAKSGAESITRNRYLEVRNAIINDIVSAAYEEIEKLSDDEYFDMLRKICIKNIASGEFIMYLNSRDLNRLPEGFEDSINSVVYKTSAVYVKKESIDIENGFVLKSDVIEINCTFKALFDENMEDIKDRLNKELFG